MMYFNTKPDVQLTPVGVDIYEHRASIRFNTRGVNFNTGVFAVYKRAIDLSRNILWRPGPARPFVN